jgi:hypothetical protein
VDAGRTVVTALAGDPGGGRVPGVVGDADGVAGLIDGQAGAVAVRVDQDLGLLALAGRGEADVGQAVVGVGPAGLAGTGPDLKRRWRRS